MLVFIILAILTIITFIWSYQKYGRILKLSSQFEGPPSYPIIGSAHLLIGTPPEEYPVLLKEYVYKIGDTVKLWIGPELNLLVGNLKDIEIILGGQRLIEKASEYKYLASWLREGLLVSKGEKWFKRRKIITPAFHFKILEQFLSIFETQGNTFINTLSKFKANDSIDLNHLISLCALDVICESAMGVSANAQQNSESKYVQAVKTISMVLHKRMFDVTYRFDFLFNLTSLARKERNALRILHDFSDNVIVSRREEVLREEEEKKNFQDENENVIGVKRKMAFLDILLKSEIDGKPLSNLDIQEEVDTFMFEGHDTTASAITFCFYNLALYPECQQKCYNEICDVMGTDRNAVVTMSDLNNLHYLELVIKETLRLYPSVPILGRKTVQECSINGKIIPAGTNLGISPFQIGRTDSIFPEAEKFIPERFNIEVGRDKMNPYCFIPFSAGPRNCIGQKFAMLEIKSIVSKVLRHFVVDLVDRTQVPILIAELILRTKNVLLFKIEPRVN